MKRMFSSDDAKDVLVIVVIILAAALLILGSLYFLPGCIPVNLLPRTVASVEGIDAGKRQVNTAVPCASPSCPVEKLDEIALKAYMVEVVK